MPALRTASRRDENAPLPTAHPRPRRQHSHSNENIPVKRPASSKPPPLASIPSSSKASKPATKPLPLQAKSFSSSAKPLHPNASYPAPAPQSEGKGQKVREALASLHAGQRSHPSSSASASTLHQARGLRTGGGTSEGLGRPGVSGLGARTTTRPSATLEALKPRNPRTPAAQVGAMGRARAAALERARPVVVKERSERPKVAKSRSIVVLEDEVSAGGGVVDRAYSPPKRAGVKSKSREMYAAALGGQFDNIPFDDFQPPSPRLGVFGGDDFPFEP